MVPPRRAVFARATTGANPIGRRARLATGGGDRDVAAKADDEVELQFLGQHPVELVVAETAIGHDAHPDIGGQDFGQAHQDLILVTSATVFQRRLSTVSQTSGVARPWRDNRDSMIVA